MRILGSVLFNAGLVVAGSTGLLAWGDSANFQAQPDYRLVVMVVWIGAVSLSLTGAYWYWDTPGK